jgi:hypothetical protein
MDSEKGVFALPGDRPPEAYVFDAVLDRLDTVAAKLTVALQLPVSEQERVKRVVRERALTNRDRHVIFEQIGEDLDFTASLIVASGFLAVWAQEFSDAVRAMIEPFDTLVPQR